MFKIGQKVVAKNFNAPNGFYPFGIVKGKIYEVESIDDCEAGHGICLVGVDSGSKKIVTVVKRMNQTHLWHGDLNL